MNPLGIALAFLGFGLVSGLGMFIVGNTTAALMRLTDGGRIRHSPVMFMYSGLLLVGMALVVAGGYATYKVIYG